MKNIFFALVLVLLMSCKEEPQFHALYRSDAFTVFADKVVQGDYTAEALSATHLRSDYSSPASATYSRLVKFKFSINEKDNELPPGLDHWVVIGEENKSAIVVFGQEPAAAPEAPEATLPANYAYTFRVDMSPVLQQFESRGYYQAWDGTRVAQSDFKGFFIAGGSEPLTWDFVNLGNQGLQLTDPDGDGIYEITLTLNPYKPEEHGEKEWKPTLDLSGKPRYRSDQPLVDALFNLSLEEAIMNIEPDSTLRTGAKWAGVWTRDISYSIWLAFAYHEPEVAKISLMKKVFRERIVQDTGSGGAWPVSSDRTTWALAAWEIYLVTGEREWLEKSYRILKNTLDDDAKVLSVSSTGLYKGESSFLDWREQTYPKWMDNADIFESENLGTNAVHFQAHRILAKMAETLGEPYQAYAQQAESLKNAINKHLWLEDAGYYSQYLYGRYFLNPSPRFEALGEAFTILFDIADAQQAKQIVGKSPLTPFGTTCIYPQIPNIPPYHNNGIWPFVQAFWNIAAAKVGNEQVLDHGLGAIYRAGALFVTNYENFVADNGDFLGTEVNSHRMLWSMAGNLAMVHRVFMGMDFTEEGLYLRPVVPTAYTGTRTLSNFRYRNAILDITIKGHGNRIARAKVNGEPIEGPAFLPADAQGAFSIEIELANNDFQGPINLVENHFSLPAPLASISGDTLSWKPVSGAKAYRIYRNGAEVVTTEHTQWPLAAADAYTQWKVSAIDELGWESFTTEPLVQELPEPPIMLDFGRFAERSSLPFTGFGGEGFVEVSATKNPEITLKLQLPEAGTYLLDIRYANGSGPWNTENKCAIRSLYLQEQYLGSLVFPQRGTDEWSDWGYSNALVVDLPKGAQVLRLVFEEWNINMNTEGINRAMLDCLRLYRLPDAAQAPEVSLR